MAIKRDQSGAPQVNAVPIYLVWFHHAWHQTKTRLFLPIVRENLYAKNDLTIS